MKPKTAEHGLGWAFCCALLLCVAACCPCAGDSPWSDPDANATHPPRPRKDGAVVLSSPGGWLGQMTSDKTHLFWVRGHRDEARVMAVPKKGGATRTVLHPGHNVTRLQIFGDHAYVSTWSGLWRVALEPLRDDGGDVGQPLALVPKRLIKARSRVNDVAVDKRHVVFCDDDRTIWRVDHGGGEPTEVMRLGPKGCARALNLGLSGGHLYWNNNELKAIHRVKLGKDGKPRGEPQVVVDDVFPSARHTFLFDGQGYLHFYRSIPTSFGRVKASGGEVQWLEPRAGGHFEGVALGDDFLYWGRGWARIGATGRSGNRGRRGGYKAGRKKGEGGVMRVSLKESAKEGSAGTSVNLVDDVQKVRGVAVDDRFVYWMDHYEGIIAKTALEED